MSLVQMPARLLAVLIEVSCGFLQSLQVYTEMYSYIALNCLLPNPYLLSYYFVHIPISYNAIQPLWLM